MVKEKETKDTNEIVFNPLADAEVIQILEGKEPEFKEEYMAGFSITKQETKKVEKESSMLSAF